MSFGARGNNCMSSLWRSSPQVLAVPRDGENGPWVKVGGDIWGKRSHRPTDGGWNQGAGARREHPPQATGASSVPSSPRGTDLCGHKPHPWSLTGPFSCK